MHHGSPFGVLSTRTTHGNPIDAPLRHPPVRELAERSSSGTRVRLLWRQGTTVLWVEVRESDTDQALAILVPAERALDAFHHPYAYAGTHNLLPPAESARRFMSTGSK